MLHLGGGAARLGADGREVAAFLVVEGGHRRIALRRPRPAVTFALLSAGPGHVAGVIAPWLGHGADLVVDGLVGVGRLDEGLIPAAPGVWGLDNHQEVALLEAVGVGLVVDVFNGIAFGIDLPTQLAVRVVLVARLVQGRLRGAHVPVGVLADGDDVAQAVELIDCPVAVAVEDLGLRHGAVQASRPGRSQGRVGVADGAASRYARGVGAADGVAYDAVLVVVFHLDPRRATCRHFVGGGDSDQVVVQRGVGGAAAVGIASRLPLREVVAVGGARDGWRRYLYQVAVVVVGEGDSPAIEV